MKLLKFTLILLIFAAHHSTAQTKKEIEETYRDANSYFYFEDYEEALALYLQVLRHQPDNANLNYRIGFCYLNIPGSKSKSIEYLQKAASNTTRNYNEQAIYETKAPLDAIFYLGNAYLVSGRINSALKEYNRFTDITQRKGSWNFDYLDHQINSAKSYTTIKKTPINYLQINLGEPLNDRFSNFNPVISGDGKTLAFTTKRKFYQAVFISTLNSQGQWDTPKNITLDLQVDGNCATLSLSHDGTELFLFKDDNHDGNIYSSHKKNGRWTPMQKLNKNINSGYYETHASISSDGKYLYFTSNRKGGFGDLDIYVSQRINGNEWGVAQNLGETINTQYNENTPFISSNGELLYFSSEGHNNIGGYDIFLSQQTNNNKWSTPINIGYPINTTDDNLFYHPIGDGSKGLLALFDSEGFGEQDICEVELFIPKFMRNIVSSTSFADRIDDSPYKNIVIDTLNRDGIAYMDISYSDIPFKLDPRKRYKLFFEGKGFDIQEKFKNVERRTAQADAVHPINVTIPPMQELPQLDTATTDPIQSRINILKQISDSTNRLAALRSGNASDSQSQALLSQQYSNEISHEDNLSEILLLLAPTNSQQQLTRILKNEWNFDKNRLNEQIIEFTNAFESFDEKNAITTALSILADKVNSIRETSTTKKSRNISNATNDAFYLTYNKLINAASPELSKLLAETLVKHPDITSIESLIAYFKKMNPEGYKTHIDELLRILARITIEDYLSLSDDQQFNLYNNITQAETGTTSNWWIYLIALIILISATGLYIYSRKKQ